MGTVFAQNGYLEHALGTLALMQNRSTEAVPYSLSYLLTTLKASRVSHDLIFITLTLIQVTVDCDSTPGGANPVAQPQAHRASGVNRGPDPGTHRPQGGARGRPDPGTHSPHGRPGVPTHRESRVSPRGFPTPPRPGASVIFTSCEI